MKRALIAVGAVLILAAPALADEVTIDKQTTTTTTTTTAPAVIPPGSTVAIAPNPPPPAQAELVPPPPDDTANWVGGHWLWNADMHAYTWVAGRYAEPPRVTAVWVPGHWVEQPNGWEWVGGYWD